MDIIKKNTQFLLQSKLGEEAALQPFIPLKDGDSARYLFLLVDGNSGLIDLVTTEHLFHDEKATVSVMLKGVGEPYTLELHSKENVPHAIQETLEKSLQSYNQAH